MFEGVDDILKELSPEQQAACTAPNNVLLTACPGSGKTRTLTHRLAYQVLQKSDSRKINIAITYTNRAAEEIINRLEDMNIDLSSIWAGTIHQFCMRYIIRPYAMYSKRLCKGYQIIDDYCKKKYGHEIAERLGIRLRNFDDPFQYENIRTEYECLLEEKKEIDFDTILLLSEELLSSCPFISSNIASVISSILVDEFQDTNLLSYWLLNFLITDKTNILLLGDSLQRIYGFIGAVPNLLSHAQNTFNLQLISLEKNYRFASNENMLQLDKIIRQNAITPFDNPNNLKSKVEFNIYDNQEEEALQVVIKSQKILQNDSFAKVAILAKQRGPNIEHIIKTFNHNKIPFFYGLFTDEDAEYIIFNRKCLYEFIELLKSNSKITKKIGKKHIDKIREIYINNDSVLVKALLELLEIFWVRLFVDYSFLSNEDTINLIKDTFEHNGIKQYMEFLNTSIIISTVHAAKGLEWDYVILPDMEKDSFPNWYGLCGKCKNGNDCNFVMTKDIEKSFFEELSVFYVAVTRAKKQVFFTASHKQLTNRGIFEKNYSCFMKLPGIEYIQTV